METKISTNAQRIANYLRFERTESGPVYMVDLERLTGIKITPALIREGDETGLFRFNNAHGSII